MSGDTILPLPVSPLPLTGMASTASKRSRKAKNKKKAETDALLTAAGTGALAAVAVGPPAAATLSAAQVGQMAPAAGKAYETAGAASAAVAVSTLMAGLVAARGGIKWLKHVVDPEDGVTEDAIAAAMQEETEREEAFMENMRKRLQRDIPDAQTQPFPVDAVDAVLEREQRYMEAHDDAAEARVRAATSRSLLKAISPEGAYWILSPNVAKHTPDAVGPGTLVAADGIQAVAARWYEGDLIEIETESGAVVTVSPNHPMLTAEGWVAARLLDESHHLMRHLDGRFGETGGKDHLDHIPASIEQRYRSLLAVGDLPRMRMPIRPQDFHVAGTDGYVAVVGPARSWREAFRFAFGCQMLDLVLRLGRSTGILEAL